ADFHQQVFFRRTTRGRRSRRFTDLVIGLDDHEKHKPYDYEIDQAVDPGPVADGIFSYIPFFSLRTGSLGKDEFEVGEVHPAGKFPYDGHHNVVYKAVDYEADRPGQDNGYGKFYHIAGHDEI